MFARLTRVFVSLLVIVAGAAGCLPAEAASGSRDAVAWLKSQGLYESVLARMEAARYAVRPSAGTRLAREGRGHEAGNPAQGLQTQFTDGGIAVAPRAVEIGDWRWTMRLDAYGHGDGLERVTTPAPVGSGNRVEYRYGRGLTEWYVNTARGVEQGFTLDAPAPGDRTSGRPLELVLAVGGDLVPRMSGTDDEIQFASADGKAVLGYRELKAWDARGRILPSRMAVVSGTVRLIVDDRDAQYPLTVDPIVFASSPLTPTNGKADDAFGFSVAISGNMAVVGAPSRETASEVFKGAAFVFIRIGAGTAWTQEAELRTSDATSQSNDLFGFAVAISGNTVVVGAPGNSPNAQKSEAGAAYVFVRKVVNGVVTWSEQAKITASDGAAGDAFGTAVTLGGDIVVIGAPDHNPGGKPLAGKAYILARSGVLWTEKAKLAGAADGDRFGYALAMTESGGLRTVVVGAPAVNTAKPGRVSVFFGIGTSWPKQADLPLNPNDLQGGDEFGFSVGISDNTVVVGAPSHSAGGVVDAGASYVFIRSGTTWSQQAKLTASDKTSGDLFGSAVDIDKNMLAVGAPFRPPTAVGQAYVFIRTGTVWVEQTQQLKADPPAPFQFFGFAVAVNGTNVAVGAPFHALGSEAGPAYVFSPTVSFAGVWIGLENSDDVGLRLDLRTEVFKGTDKVAEGQIHDVSSGGASFSNAILQTIPLEVLTNFTSYTKVTISARVSCSGVGHTVGVARLWYNGRFQDTGPLRDAGSRIEFFGLAREFLRKISGALRLSFAFGTSKEFIDRFLDSSVACRPPNAPPTAPDRPFTEFGAFVF